MANGKKSFVLYCDIIHTVRKLSPKKAGELFLTILSYVNDENPIVKDAHVDLVFEPIKRQLKRDLKDWEDERENRSKAGKKGMATRWGKAKIITKDNSVIKPITNITDNVTVTVNDTVTVNENVIEKKYSIEDCLRIALSDSRWTRANKTNESELILFNSYLEKTGRYIFLPIDYKKYFSTIKDKYPKLLKKEYTIDELKEIAKQMDEQQKLKAV